MASARRGAEGAWALAVVCAVAVAACGGSTFHELGDADGGGDSGTRGDSGGGSGDAGGGADSGSGKGSGGGGGGPVCPATPPNGGPCPVVGAECEYGSSPDPACNAIIRCGSNGWEPPPPTPACPPSKCASHYADVPVDQPCSPGGMACAYDKGDCYCTSSGPGGVSQTPRWVCVPTPNGCPSPRPAIGSACSQEGLSCDYGACDGGAAVECQSGYWQRASTPCPL